VARYTDLNATFSEEMAANTLTSSTFKLQQYNKKARKWKTIPVTITLSNTNKTPTSILSGPRSLRAPIPS
jgi:hypothetical protein